MDIKTPFDIGDKLWTTELFYYTRELDCLHCHGKPVLLASGATMPCGICNGRGTHCVSRPCKIRPVAITITGFDIHNSKGEMEYWYYSKERGNFSRPTDLFRSFLEVRRKAREDNKKHGWPKKHDCDPYDHKSKMFWGYRIGKNKK